MEYRFHLLNTLGEIQASHEVHCPDDLGALEIARSLFKENQFEVWQRSRRVFPGEVIAAHPQTWLSA